ncbi:Fe-S cluster assembly protein SufD [Kluyvera genomosp. 3]|uniref:Fe-S cluster assembly protein SufD n=1 Tax=Kluyvera genomosp. 3 TaxID=2774055 RepID=A0A6G9RPH0_9ENTR|nr:Fe-S cluster assembly protein SufD [Kluyvera genomosp. 3]QIR27671.1 Fe-S cluster assembly protein SufD [Kluyvera genomosp. 3]
MAGLASNNSALQQWHALVQARGGQASPQALEHLKQLHQLGLPTRKDEDWKYTALDKLLASTFVAPALPALTDEQRDSHAVALDAYRLVFVDGQFDPRLSDDVSNSGFDVTVNNQRQSLPEAVHPEAFLHLTETLSTSVTHIQVHRNQRPDKPLLLLHITRGLETDEMNTAHYRHHLKLAEGAQATVIEQYVSLNTVRHFTGARLTMDIADNARLQHLKLGFENDQSYHFSHNDLRLGRDSAVFSHSFLLGAAVTRHHSSAQLNGENSTLRLNSLAMPVNSEVCDSRTWLEHNQGYCNSRQLHKTIVNDKGRAVFNGVITVAPHAIKTDGQMTNNNLLLGRLAEVDTKPQLEIYADDVKCSHGATVGRIDDEQLFYLRSRGIALEEARNIILYAFAAGLTDAIALDTLKQHVLARIGLRLAGGKQ